MFAFMSVKIVGFDHARVEQIQLKLTSMNRPNLTFSHPPTLAPMANIDFSDVTASAKANIYFDGKVISHTLVTAEGDKRHSGSFTRGISLRH